MWGPTSVTANVCPQCAARDPPTAVTVHWASSATGFTASQRQHGFDGQKGARGQQRTASRSSLVAQQRLHVHASADAVAP